MGLSQALSTAMSGLRATQAAIALVGSNVANAETPGYVRKTVIQVAGMTGDYGSSVLLNGVERHLDQYLQTQLRTETSGAVYAETRWRNSEPRHAGLGEHLAVQAADGQRNGGGSGFTLGKPEVQASGRDGEGGDGWNGGVVRQATHARS